MRARIAAGLFVALAIPAPLAAQTDTARVTYRTREFAFISAGRSRGLAVGDTVDILAGVQVLARAVVVSVSDTRASARLLVDAPVDAQMMVRFLPHPAAVALAQPPLDSAPRQSEAAPPADLYQPQAQPRAPPRWYGGLSLEHSASSASGPGAATTMTIMAGDLDARLPGVRFLVRGNTRWRAGASRSLAAAATSSTLLYQAELRLGPESERWSLGLGRLMADRNAGALGFLDGARLEFRAGAGQRFGLGGGVVPRPGQLQPSGTTTRAGAWWAFGEGRALQGAVSAASDWSGGQRRRTNADLQTWWRAGAGASLSIYGTVDFPVDSSRVSSTQLTTLIASLRVALPAGFRGSLSIDRHEPLVLWNSDVQPDTLVPLPGRLTGGSVSLGRSFGRVSIDLSGGGLQRRGDPGMTTRGSLSIAGGGAYLLASYQHGDLFDYQSLSVRYLIPPRALPVTVSLGASASITRTSGGAFTMKRYSFRPEMSRHVGRGIFLSAGGDIGSWAGGSTSYLHAGVSYRFR